MSYESSFKQGFERRELAEHEAGHRRTDLDRRTDGRTENIDLRWAALEAATGTARASQIRKKGEKK